MTHPVTVVIVHSPEEAARRLGGIAVPTLIAIIKDGGYSFTNLSPGSKPWGRGKRRWGLTDSQIDAVIAGQSRQIPAPTGARRSKATADQAADVLRLHGWDGVDRLAPTRGRKAAVHAADRNRKETP
jgi:hypothetical protein